MSAIPGRGIPKTLKMIPVATLLGVQHYGANTDVSSPKNSITNIACLAKNVTKSLTGNKQSVDYECLYSLEDRMEDWHMY